MRTSVVLAALIAATRVAQRLLGSDPGQRMTALQQVRTLRPEQITADLREAIIRAVEQENRARDDRLRTLARGGRVPDEVSEFHPQALEVLISLGDPRTIPALAGAAGTGMMVMRALVAFGTEAAAPVLAIVEAPESTTSNVDGGLIVLRMLIENAATRALPAEVLARIQRAAAQRLAGAQSATVLGRAIDLAVVLQDTVLMKIVESLAADPGEVRARGIDDESVVRWVQQVAGERLSGQPPLPRCCSH